jgi:hypothetical protein
MSASTQAQQSWHSWFDCCSSVFPARRLSPETRETPLSSLWKVTRSIRPGNLLGCGSAFWHGGGHEWGFNFATDGGGLGGPQEADSAWIWLPGGFRSAPACQRRCEVPQPRSTRFTLQPGRPKAARLGLIFLGLIFLGLICKEADSRAIWLLGGSRGSARASQLALAGFVAKQKPHPRSPPTEALPLQLG